ncbi:hypothetical protein K439DRAFT_1566448 [Ramaria rubella]|nr:hypothetical protein K439DRAFT_1566448 [Ramaria rubella]
MLEEEAEDKSDNPEDDSDIHKNDGGKATANHDRLDQVHVSDMEAEVSSFRCQLAELKNHEKNVSPEPMERLASKNTKCMVMFQMQIDPEYTLRTCFQNGIYGRRQGEHTNLLEVFPDKYHNNLAGDFIHPIPGVMKPATLSLVGDKMQTARHITHHLHQYSIVGSTRHPQHFPESSSFQCIQCNYSWIASLARSAAPLQWISYGNLQR